MIWLIGNKGAKLIHISTDYVFDGTKTGAYVETDPPNPLPPDLAATILEIVRLKSIAYGVYHFTNEGKISWYDFSCEIYRMAREKKLLAKEVLIQRIVTEDYPTKTQRPKNSYLSKDKIIKTFNISPRNWETALNEFMLTINAT